MGQDGANDLSKINLLNLRKCAAQENKFFLIQKKLIIQRFNLIALSSWSDRVNAQHLPLKLMTALISCQISIRKAYQEIVLSFTLSLTLVKWNKHF